MSWRGIPAAKGELSRHARVRAQQRGIDGNMLDWLLTFGHKEHDHLGGIVVTFDGAALARASRAMGAEVSARLEQARSLYAVIDGDGRVITTGHRYRRIIRDRGLSHFRSAKSLVRMRSE